MVYKKYSFQESGGSQVSTSEIVINTNWIQNLKTLRCAQIGKYLSVKTAYQAKKKNSIIIGILKVNLNS